MVTQSELYENNARKKAQTNKSTIKDLAAPFVQTDILLLCAPFSSNRGRLVEGLIVTRKHIWQFPIQLCRDHVCVLFFFFLLSLGVVIWIISFTTLLNTHQPQLLFSFLFCSQLWSVGEDSQERPLSPTRPQGFQHPHSRQSSVDSSKFTKRKPVNNTLSATPTAAAASSSTTSLPFPDTSDVSNASLSIGIFPLPHSFLLLCSG